MAETLADLPLAERYDCVGRWADVDNEDFRAVIVRTYGEDVTYAQMLAPEVNHYYTAELSAITPRYELPRAWQPDGTPPKGEWQYVVESFNLSGETDDVVWCEYWIQAKDEERRLEKMGKRPVIKQRWCSEWAELSE